MELAQVKEPEDIPRVIKDTHTGMVGNRALCELVLRAGHAPAYLYVFDHDLPGNNDGSFHSSELWYVFGTFERCWRPMTGTDFELSRAMTAYWANFAKRKNQMEKSCQPGNHTLRRTGKTCCFKKSHTVSRWRKIHFRLLC